MSTTFESDWENTRLKERIEELEAERDLHRNRLASLLFSDYFKPEVTAGMIQEIADEYIDALAKHDQLREQVEREVFALKPTCAVALAALEDFNEQSKRQGVCLPAEIDFAIDRLREALAKVRKP